MRCTPGWRTGRVGPGDLIAHSAERRDVIAAGAGLVVFIKRWYRLDQGRVEFNELDAGW
jgi:hypothetical protein